MTQRLPRPARPKLWTGLAVGTVIGISGAPALADRAILSSGAGQERLWLASSEGGEGGEGGTPVTDTEGAALPMVTSLALMEGALRAGAELAKAGETEAAAALVANLIESHYVAIVPDLTKYGAPAFEDQLKAAIIVIGSGKPTADVTAATDAALSGISAARAADPEPKEWLEAIMFLTRKAGEEYGKGVKDGALADAGEYRESWGNVQAARALADDLARSKDGVVSAAASTAQKALGEVEAAFDGITGKGALTGDESLFAAAAARVELAAFKVK